MSYSQNDEEAEILKIVGADPAGVFLDIGAYDGITRSNTLALIRRGWRGALVEPSIYAFERLLARHGANGALWLILALVARDRGIRKFWNSNGDGVSTTEEDHFEKWKNAASFNHPVYVPTVTISELLNEFEFLREADVVSIDTEGTSVAIFASFPLWICRPRVFCVEKDGSPAILEGYARGFGYQKVYESGENIVFASA
ncbi:MAG TPA: FkbM family methyltransferase [Candidatus Binatia bacterium]|nr:FkbM family methyltransferase [Candidatus Binatia bacterium]